jgi:hypothetical protein
LSSLHFIQLFLNLNWDTLRNLILFCFIKKQMTSATISLYNDVLFIFTPICCVGGSCFICYLYLFTLTGDQHDFHFTWCSCLLTIARRVPLLKQELSTLPEHLIATPVFSVVHVAEFLVFCVVFCRSLFLFSFDYCIACPSSI